MHRWRYRQRQRPLGVRVDRKRSAHVVPLPRFITDDDACWSVYCSGRVAYPPLRGYPRPLARQALDFFKLFRAAHSLSLVQAIESLLLVDETVDMCDKFRPAVRRPPIRGSNTSSQRWRWSRRRRSVKHQWWWRRRRRPGGVRVDRRRSAHVVPLPR